MIVKQARSLDSKHFDSNNVIGSVRLMLECLTFLKMITATTGEKVLLQFSDFIEACLRTESEKIQAFKPRKQRWMISFSGN